MDDFELGGLPSASSFALCLSGGGLRATYFHLGVISTLRNHCDSDGTRLLARVKQVFSVSGGSITAAHLVLNWEKYLGSDEAFQGAVSELVSIAQRDIRGRIIRRYLFTAALQWIPRVLSPFPKSLVEHLESQYKYLFGNESFFTVGRKGTDAPALYILATNLNTGELCSFSRHGYQVERSDGACETLSKANTLPFAKCLAASSAFPPLFPPMRLEAEHLAVQKGQFPQFLSDGGVFDNLGLAKANAMRGRGEIKPSAIIVSDASAPLDWRLDHSFVWPVARNVRAFNILMNQVNQIMRAALGAGAKRSDAVVCKIGADIEDSQLSSEINGLLCGVRTDLDWFSKAEVEALILHGREVASMAFANSPHLPTVASFVAPKREQSHPPQSVIEEITGALRRSGVTKLRLFHSGDVFASCAAIVLLLLLLALFGGAPIYAIRSYFALKSDKALYEREVEAKNRAVSEMEGFQLRAATEAAMSIGVRDKEIHELKERVRVLSQSKPPSHVACRIAANGIEKYSKEFRVTRDSEWQRPGTGSGGQDGWCARLLANVQGEHPQARLEVISKDERTRSTCSPFNCPEYQYICTIKVQSEPIYNLAVSPACPNKT